MKKIFLFAAAAAMFAACSSDELPQQTAQQTPQDNGAISFSAYMQRATTRAGYVGDATTTELKNIATEGALGKSGFGVFAYYTDNFDYTPLYQPNFMYNEQVKWYGTAFKYDVTKYWPNEHGSAATSADMDRVSFFAYLPYVDTDPATGMLVDESDNVIPGDDPEMQYGITGMKRNSLQGDPTIQYVASFDQANCVDLCWGVVGPSQFWYTNSEAAKSMTAGLPWLNVRKPDGVVSDASKVKFTFRHALAKLAVNVQTDFTGDWEETDAEKTKVWVRSIRFTGIAKKAALNLNNPKAGIARWIDYYGTNELEMGESVTVYDGRKDGSEGVEGAEAINEAVLGLNPNIVQVEKQISEGKWLASGATGYQPGVTKTPVNLFRNGSDPASAVYVIPTSEKVNVEIVYDIETIDPKLPTTLSDGETHGSSIENRIIKQAVFNKLESGKSYVLNLKLGLKDVKFTATVNEDWESGGESNTYLPNNLPEFAASTSGAAQPAYISGSDNTYKFVVTGLTPGSDLSASTYVTPCSSLVICSKAGDSNDKKADENGMAFVSVTVTPSEVIDKTTSPAIQITDGTKSVVINLNQKHCALGLTAPTSTAVIVAGDSYTYTATGTSTQWQVASSSSVAAYVKVKKNGVDLVESTDYTFLNGVLTLTYATEKGDVITLTVKTGDADEETVSFTVTAAP